MEESRQRHWAYEHATLGSLAMNINVLKQLNGRRARGLFALPSQLSINSQLVICIVPRWSKPLDRCVMLYVYRSEDHRAVTIRRKEPRP